MGLAVGPATGQTNLPAAPPRATGTFEVPLNDEAPPAEGEPPPTPLRKLGLSSRQEQDLLAGIEQKIRSLNETTSRGLDNPLVRARFEKFLSAPAADTNAVAEYSAILTRIQDALQRRGERAACKMLYDLSAYEWDAGIGEALAARVESVWDMRLTQVQLDDKIKKLRKEIDSAIMNTYVLSKGESLGAPKQEEGATTTTSTPATPTNSPYTTPQVSSTFIPSLTGNISGQKIRAMEEYIRRLEAGARLKASELKSDAIEIRNRSDFQDYVTTLFATRRHLHTILAADFYRRLFGDGDYPPQMANQVNTAKEILRDVDQAVTVFKFKMENNELAGAFEHLQYAFAASEFHPALLTLDRESKRRVRAFGVNIVKLQNMLEARDFGEVEPLLKSMQQETADFDGAKVRSIVDAVKLESRLRLGAAKLAAQDGDLQTAMQEFRLAAQSWPGNPDLDLAQLGFFSSQDVKNQLQQQFDRLFESRDYRAIFEKQLALATALVGDALRGDQMKAALEKVKTVQTAIEKANVFRRNGSPFGAWEALEQAARDWAEDSVLNKMRADLAAESAEFVHQIKQGEEAERAGDIGFSLACYLNAQRLYPLSELARAGIERLSAQILDKGS
jgi:hypothetical protein